MMRPDWRYLLLCMVFTAGCAMFEGDQFTESSTQDTPEEVRLKAVLLDADDIAGAAIDVAVDGNRVVLEGFVETRSQRQRAEDLMLEHSDLDEVINNIEVK